jgi:hypothetical protein
MPHGGTVPMGGGTARGPLGPMVVTRKPYIKFWHEHCLPHGGTMSSGGGIVRKAVRAGRFGALKRTNGTVR